MNNAQKKTPLPVAAEQEGKDQIVYHTDIVPENHPNVKVSDPSLLAPGKPLMKTFDALKAMATYHLCCDIQDCCADQQSVLMTITIHGEIYTLELKKEEP